MSKSNQPAWEAGLGPRTRALPPPPLNSRNPGSYFSQRKYDTFPLLLPFYLCQSHTQTMTTLLLCPARERNPASASAHRTVLSPPNPVPPVLWLYSPCRSSPSLCSCCTPSSLPPPAPTFLFTPIPRRDRIPAPTPGTGPQRLPEGMQWGGRSEAHADPTAPALAFPSLTSSFLSVMTVTELVLPRYRSPGHTPSSHSVPRTPPEPVPVDSLYADNAGPWEVKDRSR